MDAIEFINKICPEHGRTSCSDENQCNGLYSRNEQGFGRCSRCVLMDVARGEGIPEALKGDGDSLINFCG